MVDRTRRVGGKQFGRGRRTNTFFQTSLLIVLTKLIGGELHSSKSPGNRHDEIVCQHTRSGKRQRTALSYPKNGSIKTYKNHAGTIVIKSILIIQL